MDCVLLMFIEPQAKIVDLGTMVRIDADSVATTCVFITRSELPSRRHRRPGFEKPVAVSGPLSNHPGHQNRHRGISAQLRDTFDQTRLDVLRTLGVPEPVLLERDGRLQSPISKSTTPKA